MAHAERERDSSAASSKEQASNQASPSQPQLPALHRIACARVSLSLPLSLFSSQRRPHSPLAAFSRLI
ncbi:hypothetical protein PF007_g2465 [Phytophthora fragariae]|uniref:Uncharacterized protein n=1 Tax=Phytophthora fragariae TaxID=53985 RepID=A0A6A3TEV0_9STRA|nr:hypothetical protein PF007_g2465 [Phytophthora fragariae]